MRLLFARGRRGTLAAERRARGGIRDVGGAPTAETVSPVPVYRMPPQATAGATKVETVMCCSNVMRSCAVLGRRLPLGITLGKLENHGGVAQW